MQAGEEIAGGFFVAGGDAAELFDKIDEAFDEVAFGVEREVAFPGGLSIRSWRDDRLDGSDLKALNKAVGVVAFVGEEGFGLHFGGEVSAWLMSWTCPPVRLSANGLPRASTIT